MNVTHPEPFRLLGLPDEIVLSVISFLDYDSLLSMIHVNKHLCELVQPFIYSSITVLHGDKALNLSRSLSKDQRRSQWIRSLLISTKFYQEHALMKLPTFFARMRNLRELRLETPDCNNKKPADRLYWIALQDCYENIFRDASVIVEEPEWRPLPNLKTCVLHFVDTEKELYPTSRYSSIFLHPTIEDLTVSCMTTDAPDELFHFVDDPSLLKHSTALQHLHLEECDIHAPSLEVILSFPRALKSLKLSEGTRYDSPFRAGSSRINGNMKPHHLTRALTRSCGESLESLSLALGHSRSHGQSINHANQSLNLCELVNLKSLEVSLRTLDLIRSRPECDHNTWRRLPPSLETLKIFSIHLIPPQYTARQPEIPLHNCFVTGKRHHGVPNLSKIIYSYEYYESTDDDTDFTDLLLNLVHNNAANNAPVDVDPAHPNPDVLANPILNILQQAVGAVNGLPPQPAPPVTVAPTNVNVITAPPNLNLDAPPQHIQPPRFRWRTGPAVPQAQAPLELCRSDKAKLGLLKKIYDSVLKDFISSNTTLQIELVALPHGFIPPYLFPEDKPRVQESWFTSTNPMTPDDFLQGIRHKREASRMRAESQRQNIDTRQSSTAISYDDEANLSERTRSRSRFMQRMQRGEFDEDGPPRTDPDPFNMSDEADSGTDDDEDEDDDEDDMLEFLVQQATGTFGHGDEDHDMNETSSDDSESVYVDASTEVEMSDADYHESEESSGDDY